MLARKSGAVLPFYRRGDRDALISWAQGGFLYTLQILARFVNMSLNTATDWSAHGTRTISWTLPLPANTQ